MIINKIVFRWIKRTITIPWPVRGGWNRGVNLPSPYFLSQFLPPTYFLEPISPSSLNGYVSFSPFSLLFPPISPSSQLFLGHFSLLPILFLPPPVMGQQTSQAKKVYSKTAVLFFEKCFSSEFFSHKIHLTTCWKNDHVHASTGNLNEFPVLDICIEFCVFKYPRYSQMVNNEFPLFRDVTSLWPLELSSSKEKDVFETFTFPAADERWFSVYFSQ